MYLNKISEQLDLIGMSRKLKGYYFIRASISDIIRYDFFVETKLIYHNVAEVYLTNSKNVERNIRYAIEKTWEKGSTENIYKLFGYTVDAEKGKPTNREFLCLIADKIKY